MVSYDALGCLGDKDASGAAANCQVGDEWVDVDGFRDVHGDLEAAREHRVLVHWSML